MATQGIDYKQKNDRFHVMLNEQLDTIADFRTQITIIDKNLTNAQSSLAGLNGIDAALKGIQASKNENYQRLANVQQAEKAANELFMAMGEKYTLLQQAVAILNIPQTKMQNPQLTMNSQNSASVDPVQSMPKQQTNDQVDPRTNPGGVING